MDRLLFKGLYSKIFSLIRILYVSPFAFAVSGADESLLTIMGRLDRERFLPSLVLPTKSPYKERFQEKEISLNTFPILRLKRSKNPFYWLLYILWFPLEVIYFLFLLLAKRIDLVHLNMEASLSAAFAGRILGRKVVIHYRGKTGDEPRWFFDPFFKLLHGLGHKIFCISKANSQGFRKRDLIDRIEVLHNAVDLLPFSNPKTVRYFEEKNPELREKKIILFLGRMDPQKRVEDLLEAVRSLKSFEKTHALVILGGDPKIEDESRHRDLLKRKAKEVSSPLPIYFFERDTRIPEIMASADLLVLPSVGEGFGRVVIEAMASGTTVVVADSGARPEIVGNGEFGHVCKPRDPESLAEKIKEALETPNRDLWNEKAKAYAEEHFDIENHVAKLESTYQSLLGYK